jgi:hypothetical protein
MATLDWTTVRLSIAVLGLLWPLSLFGAAIMLPVTMYEAAKGRRLSVLCDLALLGFFLFCLLAPMFFL